MNNFDLNIQNYELNDLLELFKLPYHFNENNLKEAKKIVLKTHPDKSGLAKEYFLFFSQAYKYLLKIHQLRQSSTTSNTEYHKDDLWSKEQTVLIDGKIQSMNQEDYNKWFNETFENMRIKDDIEQSGYGDWLKSDENIVNEKITNANQMNEYIMNKKKELRALVVHKEIEDVNSLGYFDLVRDTPESYGSGMFDKLQYEDLKKAHAESVIPVTEDDFHKMKKYNNTDELNRDRTQQMINNEKEWFSSHEERMNNLKQNDEDINIQRAYKLMKQDEEIRKNHNTFWSDLKRIQN